MMKRIIFLAAFFVIIGSTAQANETPQTQLEFVRKLREKGYADLAMEYLERIRSQGAPAELQAALSLEAARTQADLSHTKTAEERVAMFKSARKDLESYIQTVSGTEAAKAKLELARLIVLLGKAQLASALQEEEAKDRQDKALQAEKSYIEAGAELDAAAALLTKAAAAEKDKVVKDKLEQEQLDAKLEHAIAAMEQTECYIDLAREDLNLKRAQLAEKAVVEFMSVAKTGGLTNPTSLLASAWLVRANHLKQDPVKANDQFLAVMKQSGDHAIPAKRLARYFRLLTIPKDQTIKEDKQKLIQKEAMAWLNEYAKDHDTPEGQGVRFELGKAILQQALQIDKQGKSPKVTPYLNAAKKIFTELAVTHGEFKGRASALNLQLSLLRLDKTAKLEDLKNFDDLYLRARNELIEMSHTKEKEKRDERLNNAIDAFKYALAAADDKSSPLKVAESKYLLTWAYMVSGDVEKTIKQGEELARANPPTKYSPGAAGYLVETYAAALAKDDSADNRKKFRDFAKFVLEGRKSTWADQPITGVTMYHLALLNHREEKFAEAISILKSLPPEFSGYNYAQGQIVFMALQAKNRTKDAKEQQFFNDEMLAAMKRVKPEGNSSTLAIYFLSQLEYPKILYSEGAALLSGEKYDDADKKFVEMDTLLTKLNREFKEKQTELSQESSDGVENTLRVLTKYARRGRVDVEFRRGNFAKAIEPGLAGGIVTEIESIGKGGGPIKLPDYKVTGDILGLALRAYVQLGDVASAKKAVGLLERLSNEDGSESVDAAAQLRFVVFGIQQQLENLKKTGDKKNIEKISGNVTRFIDDISTSAKKAQPQDYFFMARCYDMVNEHAKAAGLYKRVVDEPPASLDKKPPLPPEEERQVSTYWYAKISYARQLRLAKDKKENPEIAWKVLQEVVTNPKARGHMRADFETNLCLADMDPPRLGTAITRWGKFLANKAVLDNIKVDPSIQEMYYDGYYNYVLCCYKYSQQEETAKKGQDIFFLNRAAEWIVSLEAENPEGWKIVEPRFVELMINEQVLRLRVSDVKKLRQEKAQ